MIVPSQVRIAKRPTQKGGEYYQAEPFDIIDVMNSRRTALSPSARLCAMSVGREDGCFLFQTRRVEAPRPI